MRFGGLLLWDMRFQEKYGFYFLYAVLTFLYVILLFAFPKTWSEKAAAILIFSDPAAMGLFFMGAIVLLEKSQHTPCAFAVSPVHVVEYVLAKITSLSIISLAVATVLALSARMVNLHFVLLGTVLSSIIFTLFGIMVATKITSLNQFILWTVPIEIIGFVPAILHLFGVTPVWLQYYPVNICMDMIAGHAPTAIGLLIVAVLIVILFCVSKCCVLRMWRSAGGVKL